MSKYIHLISTIHKERDTCTAENLLQILLRIKPEVIFCEISKELIELIANKRALPTLEYESISKLSEHYSFSFIAVDSFPLPDLAFRKQVLRMFHFVEQNAIYNMVKSENDEKISLLGFKYLNSVEFIKAFDQLQVLKKKVIIETGTNEVKSAYNDWINISDLRENEILENIYSYSKNNIYKTAVFLCGAAHRKTLLNKIEKMDSEVIWSFD